MSLASAVGSPRTPSSTPCPCLRNRGSISGVLSMSQEIPPRLLLLPVLFTRCGQYPSPWPAGAATPSVSHQSIHGVDPCQGLCCICSKCCRDRQGRQGQAGPAGTGRAGRDRQGRQGQARERCHGRDRQDRQDKQRNRFESGEAAESRTDVIGLLYRELQMPSTASQRLGAVQRAAGTVHLE